MLCTAKVAVVAAIVGLALVPAAAPAATPLDYLARAQNSDGGFGFAPGDESSPLASGWVGLGLAAAGLNPADVDAGRRSLLAYVRAEAADIEGVGEVERTILFLGAAGVDPRRFAGLNLLRRLRELRSDNGSYSGFVSYTSFAVLALRSAGVPPTSAAVHGPCQWLVDHQNRDGGFDLAGSGSESAADDSGYALQALAAGRAPRSAIRRAADFLRTTQNRDGGFPFQDGQASNSQSTAYATQGLVAAGVDPESVRTRGRSPLDYLRARTAANGRVAYSSTSQQTPVWVTAQALAALEGVALPVPARPRSAPRPAQGEGEEKTPAADVAQVGGPTAAEAAARAEGASGPPERSAPSPRAGSGDERIESPVRPPKAPPARLSVPAVEITDEPSRRATSSAVELAVVLAIAAGAAALVLVGLAFRRSRR